MKTINIIRGLQILMTYYIDQDGHHAYTIRKELYIGPTDRLVSKEDVEELILLGWIQEHWMNGKCAYDNYDPDEPWVCFV